MKLPIAAWYPAHSSNYSKGRNRPINKFTIHHTAANNTTLRHLWADPTRNGSSTFFVGNTKGLIEQYVDTDNTQWTNGNFASNSESLTVEVTGDWRNGYFNQVAINNLEELMLACLKIWPHLQLEYHMDVSSKPTACPADLKHKGYALAAWNRAKARLNPPKPVPQILYKKITPKRVELIRPANLWNFNFTKWSDAKSVAYYQQGYVIDVVAEATNALGAKYYMTAYSYNNGSIRATNGFNVADCKDYSTPVPKPKDPVIVVPPVDTDPTTPGDGDVVQKSVVIAFLESIVKLISDFINKLKG